VTLKKKRLKRKENAPEQLPVLAQNIGVLSLSFERLLMTCLLAKPYFLNYYPEYVLVIIIVYYCIIYLFFWISMFVDSWYAADTLAS